MRNKIGESLIRAGLLSQDALDAALAEQARTGERLGAVLVNMNLATEEEISKALAVQLGFPYVSLAQSPPDPAAVVLIPREVAVAGVCVAVSREDHVLTVAMSDPLAFSLVHDLETRTGCRLTQVVCTPAEIFKAIEIGYPDRANVPAPAPDPEFHTRQTDSDEEADSATVLSVDEIVDLIMRSATQNTASTVHIDPLQERVVVRQRIDGSMSDVVDFPGALHEHVVARLKTMSGMEVAEQRLSQEGRLRAETGAGVDVDICVSTLRTVHGEKVVLRVPGRGSSVPALLEIGMSPTALRHLRRFTRHRHGLILVAGPAGSGRSTTLAAMLASMVADRGEIVTIEDPVAYHLEGVNQTQIADTPGVTFAGALQSALQQDPDVILVGELRDGETAGAALQAARAGHLILSALAAEDAASAVARLLEIGVEPSPLAGALVGVVAQRLVRRLCVHCRRRYTPSAGMLQTLGKSDADASVVFFDAVGCDQCSHTGYRGRIGIYEVMRVTDAVRRLIAARAAEDQILQAAWKGGMVSLGEDGLAKMLAGVTTAEELFRAVAEIRETRALCAACGTAVAADFKACPACGKRLGACPYCERALQPGWNFCPYCTRSVADATSSPGLRGPGRDEPRGPGDLSPGKIAEFKK